MSRVEGGRVRGRMGMGHRILGLGMVDLATGFKIGFCNGWHLWR